MSRVQAPISVGGLSGPEDGGGCPLAGLSDGAGTRTHVAESAIARGLLMAFGVSCVGLGALGVFVPGLPTTIFLILACWAFARSNPALKRWVLSTRLFAPYARYLDGRSPMPVRAKVIAIGLMWACVGLSVWVILKSESAPVWVAWITVALAGIGTGFIAVWQPKGCVGTRCS